MNKGPNKTNHDTLWEIFEKSDVFSIGVMLHRLLDITALPSISNEYTNDEIPLLPSSQFSSAFIAFMCSLLAFHPRDRPSANEAVHKLEMLIFSPKKEECLTKETIEQWLIKKRLDLFFNIPSEDGMRGLDVELWNAYQKAMLEFFVSVEANDFIILE